MKTNAESIRGTTASPLEKTPFDGRITTKGAVHYAHLFSRPDSGEIEVAIQVAKAPCWQAATSLEIRAKAKSCCRPPSSCCPPHPIHPTMNPDSNATRRRFLAGSAALAATAVTGLQHVRAQDSKLAAQAGKFKLAYAPHPGMFKESAGNDILDQIRFCADQGFTAFEYNGLPGQSPAMQEKIGKLLADLSMQMGVFVAYSNFDEPVFAAGTKERTRRGDRPHAEGRRDRQTRRCQVVHRRPGHG
jgi:hypothetical protein